MDLLITYDNLTELERDVVFNGMIKNEYGSAPSHWIWAWAIGEVGALKITKRNQISGVVSSLVKKGLVVCHKGETRGHDSLELTKKGIELVKAHFLKTNSEFKGLY